MINPYILLILQLSYDNLRSQRRIENSGRRELSLRRSNLLYRFLWAVGYICFSSIYRMKVEGRENLPRVGPAIILPKHQFWTDIPIVGLAAFKPLNFIAKQELFAYPIVRHFLSSLGGVPVNRLNPVKSLDSFRYVEELLRKGEFIVLFPEGTYYPHTIGRGKHRFIQRILRVQEKMGKLGGQAVPFIPVGIRYDEKNFRKAVHVRLGPPIYSRGESEAEEFTRQIVAEIAKLSGLNA
jgi:1-acyl-sn-glycerol-3-phosphate acyltransferase